MEDSPDIEEALYNQWRNFRSSNQWNRVRDVIGELLTRDPDSAWLHYEMGVALYFLEQYPGSEKHLKQAIALDPGDADAFQRLAWLYIRTKRHREADEATRNAIRLAPGDIDGWLLMGELSLHYEDFPQARDSVAKAIAIDPQDLRVINLRTRVAAEDPTGAKLSPQGQIEGYQEILRRDPNNESAHYNIGLIQLYETKDFKGAEKSFRTALALDPRDKDNQKSLFKALRKRDPILRFLWFPFSAGVWIFEMFTKAWDMKWPIIFLIFTWKFFVIPALLCFVVFLLFFWPMALVYESLTLVEIHKKMGKISIYKGPMRHIHRLSLPVRASIFLLILTTFCGLVAWGWTYENVRTEIITWASRIVVGGFFLLIAAGFYLWIRDGIRNFRRRRKNADIRQTQPPVSPPPLPKSHE